MAKMIIVPKERRKYLMIHHSASPMKTTTLETIRRIHVVQNGWLDIGYTWMIDGKGNRLHGRSHVYQNAACPYYNASAWHICLFGNFEYEKPTPKQITGLEMLIRDIYHYHVPGLPIIGHYEKKATACPGKNLITLLPEIREAVR